jgi:hypothetical protein
MARSDAERREGTRERVDTRLDSASSFSFFDSMTSLNSLGDFRPSEVVAPHGTQRQAWRMNRRLSQEVSETICAPQLLSQRQAESATVLSAGQPGTVLQALPMIP